MKRKWTPPEVRDSVVAFIRTWSAKCGLAENFFLERLGLSRCRLLDWKSRFGLPNRHNGLIPKENQLMQWERDAIVDFYSTHPLEGYRRITYMMIDEDVVATSPATVYRVLKHAGAMRKWNAGSSKKGDGFDQPGKPHEHWHTDVSYLNISGTFYYFCSVLDGYSRYVLHWEIRRKMEESDIEIIHQRALEKFPGVNPRVISDNGPQFISRDFKEFIRISGMTHVRTSPFYPQSNGKIERFHGTYKRDCVRPKTPLSEDDAKKATKAFVDHYNDVRLHSAIGYVTPKTKLEGMEDEVFRMRKERLAAAEAKRRENNSLNT